MRYFFVGLATVSLSILIAACNASTGPTPPASSQNANTGQTPSSLNYSVNTTKSFTLAAPIFQGNQANIEFPASSGGASSDMFTVSTSSTMPGGLPALSTARRPASLRNVKDFTYTAQWFYDVIVSANVTFPMAPSWSVDIGTPIAGASYFIAYYDPTIPGWNIYGGGTPQGTPGPTSTNVTYVFTPAPLASPMVIPSGSPGAEFALVAITGTTPTPVPTPTQPPANLPNIIADPNFATEGANGAFSSNSSGWTPCYDPITPAESPIPGATQKPVPVVTAGINVYVNPEPTPYGGATYAALTGNTLHTSPGEPEGAQGICQTVTIPAIPYMTMAVLEGANDGSAYIAQRASIIIGGTLTPSAGTVVGATSEVQLFNDYVCTGNAGTPDHYNNCDSGYTPVVPAWTVKGPYTSQLQPYAGQTVTLFIGVWASGYTGSTSYGVYMYIDDVDLVNLP